MGAGVLLLCATGPLRSLQLRCQPVARLPRARVRPPAVPSIHATNIAQFSLLLELLKIVTTQKLHVESLCPLHHWMTPDARGCLVSPDVTLVVLDATAIPRRHAREPPSLAQGNWPRLFRCCAPPSLLIIFLFLSTQYQVELTGLQE